MFAFIQVIMAESLQDAGSISEATRVAERQHQRQRVDNVGLAHAGGPESDLQEYKPLLASESESSEYEAVQITGHRGPATGGLRRRRQAPEGTMTPRPTLPATTVGAQTTATLSPELQERFDAFVRFCMGTCPAVDPAVPSSVCDVRSNEACVKGLGLVATGSPVFPSRRLTRRHSSYYATSGSRAYLVRSCDL